MMSAFPTDVPGLVLPPDFTVVTHGCWWPERQGRGRTWFAFSLYFGILPLTNLMWPVCSATCSGRLKKAFETLRCNALNQNTTAISKVYPGIDYYVCCNANHSSILLLHHSLQTDGRSPSNMNIGYHVFFFMTPKDSLLLLFSPESTCYSERHLLGFSFAYLPPFLFLLAPLHAVTCSSAALLPLSLSRPNVLVMSTDRYFNMGHLVPEIHAPLHIHCCLHCKNTDYIFLMLIIPVKVNKTHSGVHVFQGPCPQGWPMWPKDWRRAVPLQGCRWISSDVSQNSSRDLCTGNWIPLRVNNVYILAMCYPFTTEFPPPGIYSLCSDRCCHFDSTVWISLEVWLHPINSSDWQRSHHVCQETGFINGGERRPLNLLPEPVSTTVTKKALKNDYSIFTL